LLARLTLISTNQSPVVVSDSTWKSAQEERADWQSAGFDDTQWAAARELGLPGIVWPQHPWNGTHVDGVAISPDGKTLAATGAERVIYLWNLADASLRSTLIGPEPGVLGIAFSPNSKLLASAGTDGTIRLWEAATGNPVRAMRLRGAELWGVAFSPDASLLASCGQDGAVHLWDVANGKIQKVLRGHWGTVQRLAFSSDGKLLATAGRDDRRVRLWDVATGWQLREFLQDDNIHGVAFSPDGRYLAIGSDKKRQLWDLTKDQPPLTLPGGGIIVFRPDGRMFATAESDGTVRLWAVDADPKLEKVFSLFQGGRMSIAFTPEGRHLVTANPDSAVYVLRLAERGVVANK
jgi:WD40 repeat protein